MNNGELVKATFDKVFNTEEKSLRKIVHNRNMWTKLQKESSESEDIEKWATEK